MIVRLASALLGRLELVLTSRPHQLIGPTGCICITTAVVQLLKDWVKKSHGFYPNRSTQADWTQCRTKNSSVVITTLTVKTIAVNNQLDIRSRGLRLAIVIAHTDFTRIVYCTCEMNQHYWMKGLFCDSVIRHVCENIVSPRGKSSWDNNETIATGRLRSPKTENEEIDLFRLYILFSQYRSRDDTQEIWSFVLFNKKSTCRHIHACMYPF